MESPPFDRQNYPYNAEWLEAQLAAYPHPDDYTTFAKALDRLRHREYIHEPECVYLGDPPGSLFLATYMRQITDGRRPPVVVTLPEQTKSRDDRSIMVALHTALGLELRAREDVHAGLIRAQQALHAQNVGVIVWRNFHAFTTPARGDIQAYRLNAVKHMIKVVLGVHALVMGELATVERLISSHPQLSRLFRPLRLGGGKEWTDDI